MANKRFHIESLDGIRAFAVMLVFLSHTGKGDVIPGGFGVTVFFFLSGYLITTLLRGEFERTNRIRFKDFYLRRAYRIFPPLYIAILCGLILAFLSEDAITFNFLSVLAQALHLTNYYLVFVGNNVIPHTGLLWSLAVEEHYYLLFPLILIFLLRRVSFQYIPVILFIFCIAVLLWRCYLVAETDVTGGMIYLATDTRIDSIMFGCILGLWMNPVLDKEYLFLTHKLKVIIFLIAIAVLLFSFLFRDEIFRNTFRYSLQGIALFPIFYLAIAHANWHIFRWLNWKVVRWFGRVSYSFYLFHLMSIQVALEISKQFGLDQIVWFRDITAFILALSISFMMYHFVEKRFAKMRKNIRHD